MINFGSAHNLIGIAVLMLLAGIFWHQVGMRFQPAGRLVGAAYGS